MLRFFRFIAGSAIILGFGVVGALLAYNTASAQDGPTSASSERGDCAECHLDIVESWSTSTHATAFSSADFQHAWDLQGEVGECLTCHTTGYSRRTETYEHEGVACEACHGETPDDHPPAAVAINPGVQVCEDCHTSTFSEWELSAHAEADMPCTTCHAPHTQALRADPPEQLCLTCHQDRPETYVHVTHEEQFCGDCHVYNNTEDELISVHAQTGEMPPTGHHNLVSPPACIDCHEQSSELALNNETPLLELDVEIEEARAELDTLKAQEDNAEVLRTAQGLVLGIVIGAFVMFLVNAGSKRQGGKQ